MPVAHDHGYEMTELGREHPPKRSKSDSNGHVPKSGWLRRIGRKRRSERSLQSYRRLAMQLRFDLGEPEVGHCVMLTTPGAAKEAVQAILELADMLAVEQRYRVLIIDGCTATPDGLTEDFGCRGNHGLTDLLAEDGGDPWSSIVATASENLWFLPRGTSRLGETELLKSGNLEQLLNRLRPAYDYILVLAPAILEDPVSLAYPAQVDTVLLLVAENKTLLADVDASQRALSECRARKVRLVLTASRKRWFPG